ncbi:XTP/dITP diphosphatase [Desulfopila inferna]|uniref:XTP/dITP diphosphatase n=1 Tax=Desulfopila inferna TaxID=468528 RepID=UPI00196484A7|nr:XTP/dITP diphosphatase [Desulfopila inferna]MBM9603944.1 XTP/dITP diphosphatase [Desulfopila inferna]
MVNIIVLATNNENKIKEFRTILHDFKIEIRSLSDFGPIPEAIEDGATFDENAYKKAHHVARVLGLPAIADDSGLVVNALNGEPGVYSARYAGAGASDEENVDKLLREMENVADRSAYFHCVLSVAVPSGPALTYEGKCYGTITTEKHGSNGFGYDPVFHVADFDKTFAEISPEQKNSISHRGRALAEFRSEADKVMKWLELRLMEEKPEKPDHSRFLDNDWSDR